MSLVKLQVMVKKKKGRQQMDGDNEDGAKDRKLCPEREMTKTILRVGRNETVKYVSYKNNQHK